MTTVHPSAHDLAHRRMMLGLLMSLLAHALILSIGFGVTGKSAGGAGPLRVSLAPLPVPVTAPAAPADAAPAAPPAPATVAAPVPAPASGFRIFDPPPMAPPPSPPQAQARAAGRRRPVRAKKPVSRAPASTPVIVQKDNPDAEFKVPLADTPVEAVPEAVEPRPDPHAAEEAAQREHAERQREAEEEALRTARLQEEAQVEQEQARLRNEAAARERQLAEERELGAQREARRLQEEQLRLERDRQERMAQEASRARELAAQRALAEEQAREAARLAAEDDARSLAAERERAVRQLAEETARQREAEAARQHARQLARQQEEDERARRQRAEQAAAQATREEQARQQAAQQARRQAAQATPAPQLAQETGAADTPAGPPGNSPSPGPSPGPAGGALPRAGPDGAGFAGRARELLRGIELPATPPAALRPAQQLAEGRRRVIDILERDVPLRLYVDSFRQKIERNAAQIRMQVTGGPGPADPLVSVALRSDGSVDEVTILRSSGRADLDEAIRRIVRLNARYAAFPPSVAARFDVIDIRRIWLFADNLKLVEEVR